MAQNDTDYGQIAMTAITDFEKIKGSKITWIEVAEKLRNPVYRSQYVKLLEDEAEKHGLNKEVHVQSSIASIELASNQTKLSLSPSKLIDIYNEIEDKDNFGINVPDDIYFKNIAIQEIEKNNLKYIEAKGDLEKHLNNKITDPEIAEKLNSDLEYKIAFTRYLEKDFYDKKRIGIDAKTYAEQRIASINMSLLYDHKVIKDHEGFYAQEKSSKIDDDWINNKKKSVNNDESNPILDILNKMKATPTQNGEVVYSLDDHYAFTDKGQSIQFSSNSPTDDEIIAAILLAKEKYHNSFSLTGPKDYQDRVMKIMIDNNITINFLDKKQSAIFAEMQEKTTNKTTNNSVNNESDFSNFEKSEQPSFDSDRGEPDMDQQNTNSANTNANVAQHHDNDNKKILAVRGVVRNEDGSFTNNVLLWKAPNEKGLSGKITTPDGVEHQVKADIIPRADGKSNFLAIKVKSPQEGEGKPPYVDWGYANAVNSRKDSKSVYFDEIIFNLQKLQQYAGLVLRGRVTDKVSDELHKNLGFIDKKQTRPKFEEAANNENHDNDTPVPASDTPVSASDAPVPAGNKKKTRRASA